MYILETTDEFDKWLENLKDIRAKAKITVRLQRAEKGNFGDHKSVGGGVSEMRIDEGKGYRAYYTLRGNTVVFMLCGGDKSNQQADIARAVELKGLYDGTQDQPV